LETTIPVAKNSIDSPQSFRFPWWGKIGVAGMLTALSYYLLKILGFKLKKPLIQIRYQGIEHPFYGRFNSSDGAVFNQIFDEQEYACISDIKAVELIMDCGANVGYSSLWLLQHYPQAKIVAIEPDPSNFNLFRKNLKPYGNQVSIFNAGIWPREAKLIVEAGKDGKEWAFQVRESRAGEESHLFGVSIDSLLSKSGFEKIDILKIDIETAERYLFAENYDCWLGKVKNLVIELHNQECERIFYKAMSEYDYELSMSGELTVCRNISPKVLISIAS